MDGICAVGGVRAQPGREDLRVFVENVASLDGARVAELLQAKMVSSPQPVPLQRFWRRYSPAEVGSTWHPASCSLMLPVGLLR